MTRLLLFLILPSLYASPLDLTFSVVGHGGVSGPVTNVSDSSFWWIDSSGGLTNTSLLAPYGYNPLPLGWPAFQTGSFMVSNPFYADGSDTLQISSQLLTTYAMPYFDFSFAILLEDSQVSAILYAMRPDGGVRIGDLPSPPDTYFPPSSPGVTISKEIIQSTDVSLGGEEYGAARNASCLGAQDCGVELMTDYTPGAGTYQLMFGTFSDYPTDYDYVDAQTVRSVDMIGMPEPYFWPELALYLAGLALFCRWYARKIRLWARARGM